MSENIAPKNRLQKVLSVIERGGNALPHPAILFLIFTGVVVALSSLVSKLGIQAEHPITKAVIQPFDLLSSQGLQLFLNDAVKNFSGFAPLGTVLVAMLGFGIAEKSGLLTTILRIIVLKSPKALLVPAILFAGIVSHTAGDVGYVLLIPLAAMAFHSAGLNPLAGLAICFAGVSGGFAANFLLSTADPLLSGISQEAAKIIDPNYKVSALSNWYFMSASSILIIAVGTFVAKKITIPFLGDYKGEAPRSTLTSLSSKEKSGLKWAGFTLFILMGFISWGVIPETGFLRDSTNPTVLNSAAIKGVVTLIFLIGALPGIAYGYASGEFKKSNDVIEAMQEAMKTMAPYLVLVFFASQFISLFNTSGMGLISAVKGSEVLKEWGFHPIVLMICFILLTVVLDLFIGSASAKWTLMAPIFVPMFMLQGLSPELTQASYRIADSVVNIISPLMAYFPLILAYANKYDPNAKVGTIIALMVPYSMFFLISWSLMLFAWMSLELPFGL